MYERIKESIWALRAFFTKKLGNVQPEHRGGAEQSLRDRPGGAFAEKRREESQSLAVVRSPLALLAVLFRTLQKFLPTKPGGRKEARLFSVTWPGFLFHHPFLLLTDGRSNC